MPKTKIALLYERLSRDDEIQGESFSIQNQKIMLEDYARRNGFPRFRHFTDDGISGTRFDRPAFQQMIQDVLDEKIECIVVKDECDKIELKSESPQKCGFCDVSSVF